MDKLINELEYMTPIKPMSEPTPYWIYILIIAIISILLATICLFRKRVQNCCTKFKICKQWSVKGRNKWVDQTAFELITRERGRPGQNTTHDQATPIYRPSRKLATEYMREKYLIPESAETTTSSPTMNRHSWTDNCIPDKVHTYGILKPNAELVQGKGQILKSGAPDFSGNDKSVRFDDETNPPQRNGGTKCKSWNDLRVGIPEHCHGTRGSHQSLTDLNRGSISAGTTSKRMSMNI